MTSEVCSELTYWKFPPPQPPERYGNILINRSSMNAGVKPATFSHWSHRVKHTCRVCHFELGFKMKLNTTVITEEANKKGDYCGACHNDKIAFGHTEDNCDKCHNGDIDYGKEKFKALYDLPTAKNGNTINWVKALEYGLINPKTYLQDSTEQFKSKKIINIFPKWRWVYSIAYFSHEIHGKWLGCSNCHTEIFEYAPKATEGLRMLNIIDNQYCGVCHGKVAFPVNDCRRCHPSINF